MPLHFNYHYNTVWTVTDQHSPGAMYVNAVDLMRNIEEEHFEMRFLFKNSFISVSDKFSSWSSRLVITLK